MKKFYKPKKKKYNDLRTLSREMTENKVKIILDDGFSITTKDGTRYMLYDGQVVIDER